MKKNILQNQKGFTIIELLVALAIFSVVIVGVIEVFGNSYKSYVVQDEVAEVQQNLRIARSLIEQDLRMTGSGIGSKDKDGKGGFVFLGGYNFQGKLNEPIVPITFENGGEGESDKLTINYVNWGTGCGDNASSLPSCDELPVLTVNGKHTSTSSQTVDVNEDLNAAPYNEWEKGCSCGGIDYDPNPNGNIKPKYGFLAIITDPTGSKSDVFILTDVTPHKVGGSEKQTSTIGNGPNKPFDLNGNGVLDDGETFDNDFINQVYEAGSTIQFFHPESAVAAVYELTTDGTLLRNDFPIADNIEDLQFAFCGDFNDDKTADCPPDITKGEWIYKDADLEVNGDLSADDRDKVKFINISLLGRTAKTHSKDLTSKRPELGDRKAGDSDDHFRRRLIQTTIELRNMDL